MGFYDVVKPCVVGKLHYVRPTKQPIEVDDEMAAPLVEAGSLQPYRPVSSEHPLGWPNDAEPPTEGPYALGTESSSLTVDNAREAEDQAAEQIAEQIEPPKPRRGRRRTSED